MKRRVVVTGLGLITPVGNSVEATWSALMQGQSGVDYIKKFDTEKGTVTISTADGKEVEASIVPETQFRNADNGKVAQIREKGLPAGTNIMFKTRQDGGKVVLEVIAAYCGTSSMIVFATHVQVWIKHGRE